MRRKSERPFRRVRKGRRYLPNSGTEDEEAAFDTPELEDWMTASGGK
jgi:hypothetical protein